MHEPVAALVHAQLPPHFQDAQHSVSSHRKNCVSLFRLHAQCAQVTEVTERGTRLIGEKTFNEGFLACVNRVLPCKKGMKSADRVCKFMATYASFVQDEFRAGTDDESDTPGTRFVTILLKHMLKGFRAKDKQVRLRCCQCVAQLVNALDSLEYVRRLTQRRPVRDHGEPADGAPRRP